MNSDVFAQIISITKGIHRDNKTDQEYRELNKIFKLETSYKVAPNYVIKFPEKAFGNKRSYFKKLIDYHATEKFNALIDFFPENATVEENIFSYRITYSQFKHNLVNINSYIQKYGYTKEKITETDTFIIQYLKTNSIWLFLELQERYAQFGDEEIFSLSDIYQYFFQEVPDIFYLKKKKTDPKIPAITKKLQGVRKLSFGYKYRDKEQLLNVLKSLQLKIDLLDENKTSIEELHQLLISPDYTKSNSKVFLACETTQFRAIVDAFKQHFSYFNPTSIENSGLFYTKNHIPLKKSNLYKNKVHAPKAKTEIDNIINQLQ